MKKKNTWVKLAAAAAAVAGIAYLVVRYYDTIHAWVSKLCPCCTLEDDFLVDEPCAPVPADHTPAEETPAPVAVHDDSTPVAEPSDFEE